MSASVIICVYTLDRLPDIDAGVRAVIAQEPAPAQVIVVADHNDELASIVRERFPSVLVVPSEGPPGLSAARNTGVAHATEPIVAFLDDDAEPAPGWLSGLLAPFEDDAIVGVGGQILPAWEGAPPAWFPEEYLWVVGCSYRGQPRQGPVRNPLGCSMAFRRALFEEVGGFHLAVGRLGTVPVGAEETEFCIRVRRSHPEAKIVMVDESVVRHRVPRSRQTSAYFIRRCFYEGTSKAVMRRLSDASALGVERRYATRTLPLAAIRAAGEVVRLHQPAASARRFGAVVAGLAAATAGYAYGLINSSIRQPVAGVRSA